MSDKKPLSILIYTLLIAILAAIAGFLGANYLNQEKQPVPAQESTKHPADDHTKGEAHGEQHESNGEQPAHAEEGHNDSDDHGHGAEISDLDQSIDEMWAANCEHDMPTHQCDECRYEVGTVKLDSSLLGPNGLVRTGTPEIRSSHYETRTLTGEVELDETRTVHVASPLTGLITRSFTTPGAKIEAGASLFEVDSPDIADAKSAYLKALSSLDFARKSAKREALLFSKKIAAEVDVQEALAKQNDSETEVAASKSRLLRLGLTQEEINTLAAQKDAQALHGRVIIHASRRGTVIEGHANPGEYAETGKELLTISDLDQVWILADLKESDIAIVSGIAGGMAEVKSQGRTFPATFDTIAGRMSEETRTAKARFIIDNSDGSLKPGMFVSVNLNLPTAGETLVVPKAAVLADENRTFVFVHKEDVYWIRRPVTLGARFKDMVEIVAGLEANQQIITDGSFLLKSDVLRSKMGAGCAD